MNKPNDEILTTIYALLRQSEIDLHLREGFFQSLLKEDDWSFVIKAHALIEGAVSQQLSITLDSLLHKIFRHLELGDARTGKMIFAEALGLLSKDECTYIRKLSELRNLLVHDIRTTDFKFKAHIDSLDDNQRKAFLKWVVSYAAKDARNQWLNNARENAKFYIWLFSITMVMHTSLTLIKANLDKKMLEHARKLLEIEERTLDEGVNK